MGITNLIRINSNEGFLLLVQQILHNVFGVLDGSSRIISGLRYALLQKRFL